MIAGRRLLPALLLGALAVRAASAAVLERVAVDGGSAPVVRLELSAPVAVQSRTLPARAGQPERVVIDLPGTTLGRGARGGVGGSGVLVRVRTGQFDADTARVVLDLEEPVQFRVSEADGVVTVTLSAPAEQGAPAPPPTPAQAGQDAPVSATIPGAPLPARRPMPSPSAARPGPPPTVPEERGPYLDYAPGEIAPLPGPPAVPPASRPSGEPRLRYE